MKEVERQIRKPTVLRRIAVVAADVLLIAIIVALIAAILLPVYVGTSSGPQGTNLRR